MLAIQLLFSFVLFLVLECCSGVPAGGKVLVLGSGGLIGSALVKWLEKNNYEVIPVRNRLHIDLREPHSMDQFTDMNIEFVFFLACEVGGSKFIASSQASVQQAIIENNLLMYQNVFSWLERTRTPFVFTSSYLESSPGSYGSIKRLGEAWISALGFGKIARLWNIYGFEPIGIKSHVIADWVGSCATKQQLNSQTDGKEMRQFLHTDDCANALGTMMLSYDELDLITDISSNVWTSMKRIAKIIAEEAPDQCSVSFAEVPAVMRERRSPDITSVLYHKWSPNITFSEGIKRLFNQYKNI